MSNEVNAIYDRADSLRDLANFYADNGDRYMERRCRKERRNTLQALEAL